MADIRTTVKVEGPQAVDAPVSDNPVLTGGRASDSVVTPVSNDGDAVQIWLSRRGAQYVTNVHHIAYDGAPWSLISKVAQYTTAQTGTALWTPGAGNKIMILNYKITTTGTTGGDVQLWFGASGDTAYTRGTDSAIFDGNFIPSATFSPGIAETGTWPSPTADYVLRVTDSAAINALTVVVWGYEFL